MSQSGFVYDDRTGLYYDWTTGYYYDPVSTYVSMVQSAIYDTSTKGTDEVGLIQELANEGPVGPF